MILIKNQKDSGKLLYYGANNIILYSKQKSMNVCLDLEIFQGVPESSPDFSRGLYKLGSLFF